MKYKGLWIGLLVLALLTPLGLLASGTAWGEWGADEIEKVAGFVPVGLAKLSGLWKAILPDYAIPGWEGFMKSAVGYIISALVGIGLIVGMSLVLGKLLAHPEERSA
jgi:hypothetical protein